MRAVTSMVAGAAPRRIPAARARVTVTAPVTAAVMTVTPGVGATWCAAPTTASSSAPSTTPRTTAASGRAAQVGFRVQPGPDTHCHLLARDTHHQHHLSGHHGAPGHPAAGHTSGSQVGAGRPGPGGVGARDAAPARTSRCGDMSNVYQCETMNFCFQEKYCRESSCSYGGYGSYH